MQVCHHPSLDIALWTAGPATCLLWGGVDGTPSPIATFYRESWPRLSQAAALRRMGLSWPAQLPSWPLCRALNWPTVKSMSSSNGGDCERATLLFQSCRISMTWHSNRITGGSPDEDPTLVLSQKLQLPWWHVFYALFCCLCVILGAVAWAKVGYEGMTGIGLHDVKQGINKKKKSRGHIFIAKI